MRQYVIDPPDIPTFLYKENVRAWKSLIEWAKDEFQARLRYCAERGYWKEIKRLNENSSAISILAELHGFRKMCAVMSEYAWGSLTARERQFVYRAYELRNILIG